MCSKCTTQENAKTQKLLNCCKNVEYLHTVCIYIYLRIIYHENVKIIRTQ